MEMGFTEKLRRGERKERMNQVVHMIGREWGIWSFFLLKKRYKIDWTVFFFFFTEKLRGGEGSFFFFSFFCWGGGCWGFFPIP